MLYTVLLCTVIIYTLLLGLFDMKKKQDHYISATDFKKHFLQYMNEVGSNQTSFVITKRKTPIAKVSPLDDDNKKLVSCFGIMKGSLNIKDDIVNFDSSAEWEINHE